MAGHVRTACAFVVIAADAVLLDPTREGLLSPERMAKEMRASYGAHQAREAERPQEELQEPTARIQWLQESACAGAILT